MRLLIPLALAFVATGVLAAEPDNPFPKATPESQGHHPAFAVADRRPLFKEIQVLKRFETEKKSLVLLRCECKSAPARILVVDAETGRLVGDRHIEFVPGIGRIGTRVRYLEYMEVDGVQFPVRVTLTYPSQRVDEEITSARRRKGWCV